MAKTGKSGPRSEDFGVGITISPDWAKDARERLKARGRGAQAELARQLGTTDATIHNVLHHKHASSSLVRRISEALGIELRHAPPADDEMAEWLALGSQLRRQNRAVFDNLRAVARSVVVPVPDTKKP